jgi:gas vesicle protein
MKSSGTFLSVLVAVAVGVVIGVTFAPDNGISTRKKAKKAVNAYAKKAKEELEASRN